jgi:hypothetical protein
MAAALHGYAHLTGRMARHFCQRPEGRGKRNLLCKRGAWDSPEWETPDSLGLQTPDSGGLSIEEYNTILDELEELEDIRLYDEAKAADEPSVPIDEAFKMIEAKRKSKK